jgi:hypothetical protein
MDAGTGAAMVDARVPEDAATSPLPPFEWDAAAWFPSGGETRLCALRVAAECDGAEDCDGGVCCAQFDPMTFSYTGIACADRCDSLDQFAVCHPQQPCSANGSLVCRQSLIISHAFIGVCVPPGGPSAEPIGQVSSGAIACGANACELGRERCCLTAAFDLQSAQGAPLEPRCIASDEACDCELGVADDDAGVERFGSADAQR